MIASERIFDDTFLFETKTGNALQNRNVVKEIGGAGQRVLRKDEMARVLRHTPATIKIEESGRVQGVSEYLGHSSTSKTLDLHVHGPFER